MEILQGAFKPVSSQLETEKVKETQRLKTLAEDVTFRKDFLRQRCNFWLLQRQHWRYIKTKFTISSLKDLKTTVKNTVKNKDRRRIRWEKEKDMNDREDGT